MDISSTCTVEFMDAHKMLVSTRKVLMPHEAMITPWLNTLCFWVFKGERNQESFPPTIFGTPQNKQQQQFISTTVDRQLKEFNYT